MQKVRNFIFLVPDDTALGGMRMEVLSYPYATQAEMMLLQEAFAKDAFAQQFSHVVAATAQLVMVRDTVEA